MMRAFYCGTLLLNSATKLICDNCDDRELSKCLSDYMINLLYQQPSLMFEVSGIAKQRFRDTWAEAHSLANDNVNWNA